MNENLRNITLKIFICFLINPFFVILLVSEFPYSKFCTVDYYSLFTGNELNYLKWYAARAINMSI